MNVFNSRRIADPVYGTIGLSDLEVAIINTHAFQRLRHVKQLGLAHLVFPGADYSRFAHCVGACHITGRILDNLRQVGGVTIDDDETQLYRLAALLHDIGHYPYSHAMEQALEDYRSFFLLKQGGSGDSEAPTNRNAHELPTVFTHERVGREVLVEDPEVRGVLHDFNYDGRLVSSIFMREHPPRFANLISSDLDADRIDYLLRTAHHTGLPYGSLDIDYLLSQLRIDKTEQIAVTMKALRTADHFLLSRYFDYQQVTYHKTVVALELVLKDVLARLLESGQISCTADWVTRAIRDGTWHEFDDARVTQEIREFHHALTDEADKAKARAILERRPPKLVAEVEYLGRRDHSTEMKFRLEKQIVREKRSGWADRLRISEELWYIWDPPGMALTKVGSNVPISALVEKASEETDKYQQAIRALAGSGLESHPIMEDKCSLMSVLSDFALYTLRVYVLLPEGMEGRRQEIARTVKDSVSLEWK